MRQRILVAAVLVAGAAGAMIVLRWPEQDPVAPADRAATSAVAFERVGEHFQLDDPATLTEPEAERVYQRLRGGLHDIYALSDLPAARDYQAWPRYNRVPYRSATHGERFVNNYANRLAAAYGTGRPMPVGAILAKDAVTVTRDGHIYPGPLALMEKMPAGFDPDGHDWRYTLVMPDGSLLGMTREDGDEQVAFCRDCHAAAGADADFLFFVPEAFRRPDHAVPAVGYGADPVPPVNRQGD
jgi:hypothetical protein